MKSRIILSDIHGTYKTLLALVDKLPKGVPLTFAGDLIDRSSGSRQVIDFVINGGHDAVRGNHEDLMLNDLKFRTKPDGTQQHYVDYYHSGWIHNGGQACLDSYYVDQNEELESGEILKTKVMDIDALKDHMNWMRRLPYHLHYEDLKDDKGQSLLVTHSTAADVWGHCSPENPIFQNAVTWDRVHIPKKIKGLYNVYGHTPQEFKATVKDHYACIDTGAPYKGHGRYSKLTALQFPQMVIYEQENID